MGMDCGLACLECHLGIAVVYFGVDPPWLSWHCKSNWTEYCTVQGEISHNNLLKLPVFLLPEL